MRQVIENIKPPNVVELSRVREDAYYGVLFKDKKAFISKVDYYSNNYVVRSSRGLTKGNCHGYNGSSLEEVIGNIVNSFKCNKVYEFDTPQELFAWLAE